LVDDFELETLSDVISQSSLSVPESVVHGLLITVEHVIAVLTP
jgi:hypothetical protein